MSGEWHVDPDLAGRYASGATGAGLAASVEAHVVACPACRARFHGVVESERIDRIWTGVLAELDAPRPRFVERLLTRLGLPEDTARLLVTTPSLRLSWLLGLALVLGIGLWSAGYGDRGRLLFLTLAPLLTVAGVAAAFTGVLDPIRDVAAASPYPRYRLVLLRVLAVLVTSIGSTALAGRLVLDDAWLATAWLLPALALVTATLLLSTRFDPLHVGAALGLAWAAGVWAHASPARVSFAAFSPAAQAVYALVLFGAATVMAVRHAAADHHRKGR